MLILPKEQIVQLSKPMPLVNWFGFADALTLAFQNKAREKGVQVTRKSLTFRPDFLEVQIQIQQPTPDPKLIKYKQTPDGKKAIPVQRTAIRLEGAQIHVNVESGVFTDEEIGKILIETWSKGWVRFTWQPN